MNYRQVIENLWVAAQKAIRVVDIGPETLEEVDSNTVTVSTTLRTIGNWFGPLSGDEVTAEFQVISGGPINVNTTIAKSPTAGGTEGSKQAKSGDTVHVVGAPNIARFKAILATGGADAEVRGSLSRRG